MWVAHWQLVVKPFDDSRAVFDVNACLGQKVCTKDDIVLALSIKDLCLLFFHYTIFVKIG
jgi:hypothetical protein